MIAKKNVREMSDLTYIQVMMVINAYNNMQQSVYLGMFVQYNCIIYKYCVSICVDTKYKLHTNTL